MKTGVRGKEVKVTDASQSLSAQQRRLWVLDQLEPNNASHQIRVCLKIYGAVNAQLLEKATQALHTRHDVLRSRFVVETDEPRSVIIAASRTPFDVVDLMSLPEQEREEALRALLAKDSKLALDLQAGRLSRCTLYRLGTDEHLYVLTFHKIICDRESALILSKDLAAAYASMVADAPLPPASSQYQDFVQSQESYLRGDAGKADLAYWRNKLAAAPNGLEVATDRPRPVSASLRGSEQRTTISGDLLKAIRTFSEREGCSPLITLLTAFSCMLGRYTGADDIVIGTELPGRINPAFAQAVGAFSNEVALRLIYSGETSFAEMLRRVSGTWTEAQQHQKLPFGTLVEVLNVRRDTSRNPLFQTSFSNRIAAEPFEAGGLRWEPLRVAAGTESLDLSVEVNEHDREIGIGFSYSTDLFERATIERTMGHFRTLLQSAIEGPDKAVSTLQLLTAAEHHQLVIELNETHVSQPAIECIHQIVERQVDRTPDAIALMFEGQSLTYRELNARANQLAHYLAGKGVRAGSLVAIFMERSVEMLVAVLATLKSGAGYVPLDPAYPTDRLAFMLSDASPAVLLTQQEMAGRLAQGAKNIVCVDSSREEISKYSVDNLQSDATRDDLVYVIYTSGSTGKPKGVCLPHRALTNLIFWQLDHSHLPEGARTIQFTSLSFDVSFQEIFSTWSSGGTLVLISETLRRDPVGLLRFLREQRIGRLFLPFVALQHLAEAAEQDAESLPDTLREVVTAGEQLRITPQLADFFARIPTCSLYNHYGPSESHVVTSFLLSGPKSTWPALPPIGKPIANTQIYILDSNLNPVPVGIGGELYIGGVCLATGYLKRPDLTEQRFIRNRFSQDPAAHLYKTGDLARVLADGNIEYLGRTDHQVKIRGFRVELGEIENALDRHPVVRQAAVIVREDNHGQKWLVAYIVPNDENPSVQDLRKYLAQSLPEYMIPARFSFLPELPLTPSGKVDRKSLPSSIPEHHDHIDKLAPRNETEAMVVAIFQKLLGLENVGVRDDFFELGGHSLLAGRLLARINEKTGRQIPLAALFRAATVESLAQLIDQGVEVGGDPVALEIQRGQVDRPPFFAIVPPGEESLGYAMLARHMGPQQTVYKIQGHSPVTGGKRPYSEAEIRALTEEYVSAMRSVQTHGPYCLGGLCDGTHIAEQIVLKLESDGEEVGLFAIFDTWVLQHSQNRFLWKIHYYGERLRQMRSLSLAEQLASYKRVAENKVQSVARSTAARTDWRQAYWPENFVPTSFCAPVVLFKRPKQPFYYVNDPKMGWAERSRGGVTVHEVDFHHAEILREPHVGVFGRKLDEHMTQLAVEHDEESLVGSVPGRRGK